MRVVVIASVIGVVSALLAAAGCGGGTEERESRGAEQFPATCGIVPPNLEGTWALTIERKDVTPEVHDIQVGRFEMTFGPGKAHSVTAPAGNTFSFGPLCVDGNRIQFADETPAGGACSGFGKSLYSWRVAGDELTFEQIRDGCVYRAFPNTLRPWTRRR